MKVERILMKLSGSSSSQHVEKAKILVTNGDSEKIRNICVIAHVDHGKTSLTDFFLASNQHISMRQIEGGQKTGEAVRFLDSRLDEIDRQITIKSSCVSLVFQEEYLINLIDSPGHIDFAAEVSAAARLTDGAVLVVDVVEGVRAQTCAVVRQAWENRVVPILFLNKIDKLVSLTDVQEANNRIRRVIENVNLLFHDLLEAEKEQLGLDQIVDDRFVFDPVKGNVLFGSALHGWAFDLSAWTDLLVNPKMDKLFNQKKIPIEYMYGEHALGPGGNPVAVSEEHPVSFFAKFVIDQIWTLYSSDTAQAQCKLAKHFPVAKSVIESVVKHLPSPQEAMLTRSRLFMESPSLQGIECDKESVVAFVVKHHPADLNIGCLLGDRVDHIRKLTGFVGISRVFQGRIFSGCSVLFDVDANNLSCKKAVAIKQIFMLMGTSLVPVSSAVAGCVVAIEFGSELTDAGGVTLSSSISFPPFISPYRSAQAIVRVTAEVKKSMDESLLDQGLRLLARSDPAVLVARHPQTGERIIGCCGDEHLARCLQDLESLFAVGVSLVISAPIVEIRESVGIAFGSEEAESLPAWLGEFSSFTSIYQRSKAATFTSSDGSSSVTVGANPLPTSAMEWITRNEDSLKSLFHERRVPQQGSFLSGKSFDACMHLVKETLSSFGVAHMQDIFVKSDAFNVLSSQMLLSDNIKFGFQQACLSGPLAE